MNNFIGVAIAIACVAIFALVFIVVGIILIVRSRRDKDKAQQSLGWPSVDGKVLESRVVTSTSTDEDSTMEMYKPYVKYEYQVGGVGYTNDKVKVGMAISSSNAKPAQEVVARHSVGSPVKVYFNPANPEDSVLEQKSSNKATLVIGIVFLVIGLCGGIPGMIALLVSVFNISTSGTN